MQNEEEPEDTSKQAFSSVRKKIGKMHIECMEAMRKIGRATANEIAVAVSDNFARRTTLRRRVQELEPLGKARKSGVKICDATGTKATAYELN